MILTNFSGTVIRRGESIEKWISELWQGGKLKEVKTLTEEEADKIFEILNPVKQKITINENEVK